MTLLADILECSSAKEATRSSTAVANYSIVSALIIASRAWRLDNRCLRARGGRIMLPATALETVDQLLHRRQRHQGKNVSEEVRSGRGLGRDASESWVCRLSNVIIRCKDGHFEGRLSSTTVYETFSRPLSKRVRKEGNLHAHHRFSETTMPPTDA